VSEGQCWERTVLGGGTALDQRPQDSHNSKNLENPALFIHFIGNQNHALRRIASQYYSYYSRTRSTTVRLYSYCTSATSATSASTAVLRDMYEYCEYMYEYEYEYEYY
jgi:hypothetical protein